MIAIAPTDLKWFDVLKSELLPMEINFWTPTPWNIRRLREGDQLYFLLKSPIRKIGGYGFYKDYQNLTPKEAWKKFGKGNGVLNYTELISRCNKYIGKNSARKSLNNNSTIGCIILTNPVFLDEAEYFKPEEIGLEFPKQVVKLKYFDDTTIEKQPVYRNKESVFSIIKEEKSNYFLSKSKERIGQSRFRQNVMKAYGYKCAVTGETCSEVLQAAHIQPYINENSNHIQNGIVLRADIHRLFDSGMITINREHIVTVSSLLINSDYFKLNGKKIYLPEKSEDYPSIEALKLHNSNVFR
ncbi:HNH endonuclease [Brevibacillus laterosporus]|uniref:HNH endonuclease n=1 Tax=Brevibacillus laterosporus TaxID=1465 RepID=A0AAP3DKD5_BRELA|nr:HNH endonuclease [Brevibacillus laterosporus]MCR8982760.1 HNH endonuclease [Brevibacillus laterosporus]MCZ0809916.1 HNH endonuclease [Brevibacillus laterosporus]MCZ0828474.1 HNH endonuclease [Brevibacillus laterosporus]MCZ0852539.1 HNH endonuclease [Brevibacillus laterosporus]